MNSQVRPKMNAPAITSGVTRPHEIHKAIKDASLRVIEIQLAELLHHGVVDRFATDVYPRRTEYHLTWLGKSILPIFSQIDLWGTAHVSSVRNKTLSVELQ